MIDVSARGCTLKSPDKPELASILNVPMMAAGKLLLRLKGCGINLQPKDADGQAQEGRPEGCGPREGAARRADAARLALPARAQPVEPLARSEDYRTAQQERRLLDAEDEAPPPADPYAASEGDWPCLEYAYRRATLISALDADATCNETPLKEGVSHSTPLECLKGEDPDVTDVLHSSSHLYQDTVRQLMDEIRPLSFTAA